ncbi:FecCD family ABC transporter permease [Pseudooceanicola aestuarii]|uniref:FecCD family ABC transporter permease n=1 Tax=Pseudooceanicola aestuarii TaxID=2697319 RepID=UPI00195417B9|nr:iron ABC transporter permease [Pseudooceanicola aestuarii]
MTPGARNEAYRLGAPRNGAILILLMLMLIALALWSLTIGATEITPVEVLRAFTAPEGRRADIVLHDVRLPRMAAALIIGALLAVAGAIMQAVTGNPMADPGLLGVNAGAAFAVVLAIALAGITATGTLIWIAFAGAGLAAGAVYGLGAAGRSGATPVKLVLAGVVVASFLTALTTAVMVVDAQTFDVVRLWTAGSVKGRQMQDILAVLPHALVGLVLALALRGQFDALALGADVASGLGQSQALWRPIAALLVVVLAGSAVALAGPVGFVGLVVPHIVRLSLGGDYRRLLPVAALVGAGLTLLADTLPRALWGRDMPVGITLALIGAPVFVWLARRAGGAA